MKVIDLDTWGRAAHFKFFKRMDYPQYNICANLDITRFKDVVQQYDLSFYYAMIFAATHVLNQVEEFRFRIRGEQVIIHDSIHPSFTDMSVGSDLFKMVTVDMESSINDFVVKAADKSKQQTDFIVPRDLEGRDDLTYITCIPWVSFTSLSHTISFNKDDSIPRLAWGKYYMDGNRIMLPFSVQAHHSFVDGIHMGKYIDKLQEYCHGLA